MEGIKEKEGMALKEGREGTKGKEGYGKIRKGRIKKEGRKEGMKLKEG